MSMKTFCFSFYNPKISEKDVFPFRRCNSHFFLLRSFNMLYNVTSLNIMHSMRILAALQNLSDVEEYQRMRECECREGLFLSLIYVLSISVDINQNNVEVSVHFKILSTQSSFVFIGCNENYGSFPFPPKIQENGFKRTFIIFGYSPYP